MFIEAPAFIDSVSSRGAQCGLAAHCAPNGASVDLGGLGAINISLLAEQRQKASSKHQLGRPQRRDMSALTLFLVG